MSKLNQILVSVTLITAVVLGILLSGFWILKETFEYDYSVWKGLSSTCFNKDYNKSTLNICAASNQTYSLFPSVIRWVNKESYHKFLREKFFWDCYSGYPSPETCSMEADKYEKTL